MEELIIPPIQLLCFENVLNIYDGFNCLFSRLDPFLVLSSELLLLSFECCYGKDLPSDGLFCRLQISQDSNFGKRAARGRPQ